MPSRAKNTAAFCLALQKKIFILCKEDDPGLVARKVIADEIKNTHTTMNTHGSLAIPDYMYFILRVCHPITVIVVNQTTRCDTKYPVIFFI